MRVDMMGLLASFSFALDCVEAELVQVTTGHSKRVAYMSVKMAQVFGIQGEALQDLTACALLHDNALTQYIAEEYHNRTNSVAKHCIYGEENGKNYPFHTDVSGVILYHHENADGTGPFQKTWQEIHLFSRIIHLCDNMDRYCRPKQFAQEEWDKAESYLRKQEGISFDKECVDAFFQVFDRESFQQMKQENLEQLLWSSVPRQAKEYPFETLKKLTDLFAKITDYKSEFTSRHSMGVARKAAWLAQKMQYSESDVQKMYLAGALHDIGKVAIGNEILEKPAGLTEEEFARMKNHAWYTWKLLSGIEGFEEIAKWAAHHHERLDGTGYPFGKKAEELSEPERIMACVDIYQALTEERPYKKGMSHEKACAIMRDMAARNWIDSRITEQIAEK